MAGQLLSLRLLSVLVIAVVADPAPGRIPKVYNALITSNQNLEPSKAYPVYQPVLHDAFAYSLQPAVFYGGEFPFHNGIFPAPALPPKDPQPSSTPTEEKPESPTTSSPSTENLPSSPEPSNPEPDANKPTSAPPVPPHTQSPIPLNEFGLPPQILPLGRVDPAYSGFTQLGPLPYTYSYPGLRLYDPFDPFSLGPFASFPLYRPFTNFLGHSLPVVSGKEAPPVTVPSPSAGPSAQTPPTEPSDLNVLNYSSKDPAIPNVPPPPLPKGGLKDDKSE